MKKQTAIKWLINELENNGIKHIDLCEEIITRAKAMEGEQIVYSFENGYNSGYKDDAKRGIDFYIETFKNNE